MVGANAGVENADDGGAGEGRGERRLLCVGGNDGTVWFSWSVRGGRIGCSSVRVVGVRLVSVHSRPMRKVDAVERVGLYIHVAGRARRQ